ncbi:class I adenylate-forming enzyme family protein [Sulfurimonas sp. HSL-1716]|uniref:class I adenylate-forming enzyme family protein n=1 Tax=Hydrocurvibacter sulfurireducens TaxID=3131937 RepID=UPI0031F9DDDB
MIINFLIKNAKQFPDRAAIIVSDKTYTYSELTEDVKCLSQLLENVGVQKKEHILILLDNSYEFVVTMFAVANLGAVLVPINTTMSDDAIEKAMKSSDIQYIIGLSNVIKQHADKLQTILDSKKWIVVGEKVLESKVFQDIKRYRTKTYSLGQYDIDITSPYILTMTSGSTGEPKPIIFSQETKINRAMLSAKELYGLIQEDVIIASSPMYHSLAQRLVLLPIMLGATSVLLKKFNPQVWLEAVEKHKVSFAILVASNLELLLLKLKEKTFNLDSLRTVVSSSALLKDDIKSECIKQFNADFHEMYGASEIGTATNLSPNDSKNKVSSVGTPLRYVDLKIVDDNGEEVVANTEGEIICKTLTKFVGYYKNEKATNESVKNGYFYTGDIGYVDDEGFLYFKGRKKDVINVGGTLVYPKDIEDVISKFEFVEECAVIGVDDIYFGEAVVAVIVPKKNMDFNLTKIKLECRNSLADFQQPMGYEIIEALPKNSMGKVMKFKIQEMFKDYDASALIRKLMKI